jgi:Holliday junction resolvase
MEQQIQNKIIKQLEKEGFFVLKLIRTNKNGIPDLLVIKDNIPTFIEVKQPKGKLSEVQKYRIEEMREKGLNVKIWQGYEQEFHYDK